MPPRQTASSVEYVEQLTMTDFDHLIAIDQSTRQLKIFRIDALGHRTLFTAVEIPVTSGWTAECEQFAAQLGENLLMDSPKARHLLGL
jgi:hypothetical protein